MAEFIERNPRPERDSAQQDIVARAVADWIAKRRKSPPPPVPIDPIQAAAWWRTKMQQPSTPDTHARNALLVFLDLDEKDRSFILAAREDLVFYRGDSALAFAQIYEETMKFRKDPDKFKAKAIKMTKKAVARMMRKKTTASKENPA